MQMLVKIRLRQRELGIRAGRSRASWRFIQRMNAGIGTMAMERVVMVAVEWIDPELPGVDLYISISRFKLKRWVMDHLHQHERQRCQTRAGNDRHTSVDL
jgi:hypothetical protein